MTDADNLIVMTKEQAIELGLNKYYTGKPCIHGHLSKRYIHKDKRTGTCCECAHISIKNNWKRNKQTVKEKKNKEYKNNPIGKVLWQIKSHARRRKLEFSLTREDIFIPDNCPCCGIKMHFREIGVDFAREDTPSLDRVDNSKGYVPGNVAFICYRCNSIKRNGTAKEHRQIADWMDSFYNKKSATF